ncbi:MAG: Sua5 family C-terminal domain-containing protein, partial [Pseudomonadota bacterium]
PSPVHDAHPYAIQLSAAGDLREAAARLFAAMREADALCASETLSGIAVAPIPNTGLGEAINDRLTRAAAPRHGFAAGADRTHKSVDPQS